MNLKNLFLKYKVYIIVFIFLLLLVSSIVLKKGKSSKNPIIVDALEKNEPTTDEEDVLETYSVDIKGAVKKPGVYKVVKGSNVADVIDMAGGLNSNATTININLSKKISDEMVIYIYTKSEYNKLKSNSTDNSNNIKEECQVTKSSVDISPCLINKDNSIITNSDSDSQVSDQVSVDNNISSLININTASKDELLTLTGIGESKADCIIAYRQEIGMFNNIEEIKNVSGIGEALFEKIKDKITV